MNRNTFSQAGAVIATVVWGTGNVGRAAVRAVEAHPALKLSAVVVHDPDKVGRDAWPSLGTRSPVEHVTGEHMTGE